MNIHRSDKAIDDKHVSNVERIDFIYHSFISSTITRRLSHLSELSLSLSLPIIPSNRIIVIVHYEANYNYSVML